MELELRHLRVVCAIADAGSVTKAAATLGLAAPALTTQLQRIERALGSQLFERDHLGSRPTPLGDLIVARARMLLPAVDDLQDEVARFAAGKFSHLRIGALNGPIVAGLARRLVSTKPAVHMTTHSSWSSDEIVEMVSTGRLDFGFIGVCGNAQIGDDSGLVWKELATAPVFVLLPESHHLAGASEVEIGELAEENWAATPGDGCFGDCFAAACARAGFTPRPMYETDTAACIDLVCEGMAVALCQATIRHAPGVVAVPLAGAPLQWRHMVCWHPDSSAAELSDRILSHAIDAYIEASKRSTSYLAWLNAHGFDVLNPMFDTV